MDKILPAYNDPLFSILIIVLLILMVAVVSFFMGNYKEEKQRKNLKNFLELQPELKFTFNKNKKIKYFFYKIF